MSTCYNRSFSKNPNPTFLISKNEVSLYEVLKSSNPQNFEL